MARNIFPQCKQCRREGDKLFLKGERCYTSKCAMVKRNYPPGAHGNAKTRSKLSGYGLQLREKQKAKKIYGILEKQFRNYFLKASRQTGNNIENFARLLESRLDNVVYRAGFASSRKLARQLVSHGHFKVNGKRCDVPSYHVKTNDKIIPKSQILKKKYYQELGKALEKHGAPNWMEIDKKNYTINIKSLPRLTDAQQNLSLQLVVEFYSR
jgi:small subunit ribosomal protein S4